MVACLSAESGCVLRPSLFADSAQAGLLHHCQCVTCQWMPVSDHWRRVLCNSVQNRPARSPIIRVALATHWQATLFLSSAASLPVFACPSKIGRTRIGFTDPPETWMRKGHPSPTVTGDCQEAWWWLDGPLKYRNWRRSRTKKNVSRSVNKKLFTFKSNKIVK